MPAARRVLFGVFDWGLGHATRDTPLIQALLDAGDRVEILSTGRAYKVLKQRFGAHCAFHDIPSVSSPHTRTRHFTASFVVSIPKMLVSLRRARSAVGKIIRSGHYDLVISDCRFDVYDGVQNSVLVNHQLRFKVGRAMQAVGEAWLAAAMSHYGRIVVPDYPDSKNLSGLLSHEIRHVDSSRVHFIGILSHVRRRKAERDVDYFISLTGSEPQRSILERKIIAQSQDLKGKVVIAGGNPDLHRAETFGSVRFLSYLEPEQQEEMMNRARCFVSRSGYTTLMELAELGVMQALLIPTPGIPEQEYLGDYCEGKGYFRHTHQHEMSLLADTSRLTGTNGFTPPWRTKESVRRFLDVLGGTPGC